MREVSDGTIAQCTICFRDQAESKDDQVCFLCAPRLKKRTKLTLDKLREIIIRHPNAFPSDGIPMSEHKSAFARIARNQCRSIGHWYIYEKWGRPVHELTPDRVKVLLVYVEEALSDNVIRAEKVLQTSKHLLAERKRALKAVVAGRKGRRGR